MNQCQKCGTEFEGNFCPLCGAPRREQTICPKCKSAVADDAKLCAACGCLLKEQPFAGRAESKSYPAPVPPEPVAKPILSAVSKPEGILKKANSYYRSKFDCFVWGHIITATLLLLAATFLGVFHP